MVNGNKLSSLVRHHIREFTLRFPGVLIVFFLSLTYLVNGNKVSGKKRAKGLKPFPTNL